MCVWLFVLVCVVEWDYCCVEYVVDFGDGCVEVGDILFVFGDEYVMDGFECVLL